MNSFLKRVILGVERRGWLNALPDRLYLQLMFRTIMDQKLDLKNPTTFNQKLQWLKLYNRKPEYTEYVDKHLVKQYIADAFGEQYIIPTLGVWKKPDDIDFDALPDKFVLKCNHNSGRGMYICKDKSKMDIDAVKKKLQEGIKENYYLKGREWPYKNVKPRIIAEKYMEQSDGGGLVDYKFFCFGKRVDSVMVCLDRHIGDTKFYFFNKKWELLKYNKRGKEAPEGFTIAKPDNMDKLFEMAEAIAEKINAPYSRIDLYNVDGNPYFGEITFFPDSGFDSNLLPETDQYFGSLIHLNQER